MRLWHVDLLPILPRMQILGQHREAASLRGLGWGKSHRIVNYVFKHNPFYLYVYHLQVMREMRARGYKPDLLWLDPCYRGKRCAPRQTVPDFPLDIRYPEHNMEYLKVCLENLKEKIDNAPEGKYSREEKNKIYEAYNANCKTDIQ